MIRAAALAWRTALLAATAWLAAAAANSDEPSEPFHVSGSEVRTVDASNSSRAYDLYVKLPPGYGAPDAEDRVYPVIYFNDAGYCWLTAVGATRAPYNFGALEPAILVGVSYAKGDSALTSRARDYTPESVSGAKVEHGGARAYLDVLKNDVIPFIEREYHADPARRTLVGHSYGALFGAFALVEAPGLFQDYVLTSPSLWHADEAILELEARANVEGRALSGRVFLAIGSTETPAVNGGRHDMVGQQGVFADRLRARGYPDLRVRDVVIEDATHLTTYPIGLMQALAWLLPGTDPYGG